MTLIFLLVISCTKSERFVERGNKRFMYEVLRIIYTNLMVFMIALNQYQTSIPLVMFFLYFEILLVLDDDLKVS